MQTQELLYTIYPTRDRVSPTRFGTASELHVQYGSSCTATVYDITIMAINNAVESQAGDRPIERERDTAI